MKTLANKIKLPDDNTSQFSFDKIKKVKLIYHFIHGAVLVIQYSNCLVTASIGEDHVVVHSQPTAMQRQFFMSDGGDNDQKVFFAEENDGKNTISSLGFVYRDNKTVI